MWFSHATQDRFCIGPLYAPQLKFIPPPYQMPGYDPAIRHKMGNFVGVLPRQSPSLAVGSEETRPTQQN